MKRFFLASVTLLSLTCFSQEQPKVNTTQPPLLQVFQGYIIKVIPNDKGRYHYDILQQGKVVINQRLNPFDLSLKGLLNKEDAFKIAQWQIQQLTAGAPPAVISGQPLPSVLAKQLNISLE